jgi:hypothetical protein
MEHFPIFYLDPAEELHDLFDPRWSFAIAKAKPPFVQLA